MRSLVALSLIALSLIALTLIAAPGAAQESPPSEAAEVDPARAAFDRGRELFEEQSYALALEAFEESYRLLEGQALQPVLLYNIGICHDLLGRPAAAIVHFERFLVEAPDETPNRERARRRLAELRLRASQSAAGEEPRDTADTPETEPEPQPAGTDLRPAAIASFVVGGVGLLTWASLGTAVAVRDASFEPGCAISGACSAADLDAQDALAVVADIGFALTLAGAGLGALLWVLSDHESDDDPEAPSATVGPFMGPTGGGASLRGRF